MSSNLIHSPTVGPWTPRGVLRDQRRVQKGKLLSILHTRVSSQMYLLPGFRYFLKFNNCEGPIWNTLSQSQHKSCLPSEK